MLFRSGRSQEPFFLGGVVSPPLRGEAGPLGPEGYVRRALEALAQKADAAADERVFRPLCVQFNPFATHFMDRILGARVYFIPSSGQWHNDYLPTPVGQLAEPYLESNETWALARRATETFLAADVGLPVFALPTIASPLNVFVNLYGQDALLAFLTDPEGARHDLEVITRLSCRMHEWYLDRLPPKQLQPVLPSTRFQPPGYGQLCGCSTQMISPETYREFFVPLEDRMYRVYPRRAGMIHLCGSHTQHLPAWRDMPSLKALQLNGGALEDIEAYYASTRDDQIVYAVMHDEPPAMAERILAAGGGQRTVFSGAGAAHALGSSCITA